MLVDPSRSATVQLQYLKLQNGLSSVHLISPGCLTGDDRRDSVLRGHGLIEFGFRENVHVSGFGSPLNEFRKMAVSV
jgi:hypothetical protein